MGQITQICKLVLIAYFLIAVSIIYKLELQIRHPTVNTFSGSTPKKSMISQTKKNFNRIDLSVVKEETLEELFFESVIFDDWENSKNIASEINKLNKENLTANLFLLVDDFISKKDLNLSNFQIWKDI